MVIFLAILLCSLCLSCSHNPFTEKEVVLVIRETNAWEETWAIPAWHTLVLSSGEKIHMESGVKRIKAIVPRNESVYAAAYPLGAGTPYGCAISPGEDGLFTMTQEEGRLASYFLDLYEDYGTALSHLDYTILRNAMKKSGIPPLDLNLTRMTADILNGEFSSSSLAALPKQVVDVQALPSGRWVPERLDDETFWFTGEEVSLTLRDGIHNYYCRELELLFRVLVDSNGGKRFQSVRRVPFWAI